MKSLFALTALLASGAAFATSPYYGPYLVKTVGNPKRDKSWVLCRILPSSVKITHYVDGQPKPSTAEELDLDAKKLEHQIAEASKAPVQKAVHIVETRPNIRVEAGIAPKTLPFTVFWDGSAMEWRTGKAAEELKKLADTHCGKLKPQDSPREE